MDTLCIDIGGTGIKAIVLDTEGAPRSERALADTPQPATPDAVLATIDAITRPLGVPDRLSIGFPGVVRDGVIKTAPHLDPSWHGFPLARHVEESSGKPVRVLNDAVIAGYGVIECRGLELVITLGTGLGCCLYVDGKAGPLELGHHPYKKGKTYEDMIGNVACRDVGKKRWRKRVLRAIAQMEALFNYDRIYVGGGNARLLKPESLPENAVLVDNHAGLLGGIRIWA